MTQNKQNILLVDDLKENLQVLDKILSNHGYKVRKTLDPETALLACQSSQPDLVILDIRMPKMDGYTVCQRLKSNLLTSDIPVIFISALNDVLDKVKAFQVGGADYVSKPFQEEEVLARVKHQLLLKQQRKNLEAEIKKRQKKEEELQQEIFRHQQTTEILYQSRAFISSILNHSLDGIAALEAVRDPKTGNIEDFRCLLVNPVIANILDRSKDQLIGKILFKRIVSRIDPYLISKVVEVVETGHSFKEDFYYKTEHQEAWYHVIAVKLGDGVSLTIRDVTERKLLELQLSHANKELKNLAIVDGLTQLKNRFYFDQRFEQEWRRCMRESQHLALIMCDVDYFKSYNDTYGHPMGDECLKQVADVIQGIIKRPSDLAARYGGEEFILLLANTSLEGALRIAESVRQGVEVLRIPHERSPISPHVTLSCGVATMIPTLDALSGTLLYMADQALYEAKNRGRNQVV
ncbi:diguanylate cyclase [Spirulina subsalsa FACHB-351]|uniref:Diguanylate cyclase n=1 Tax=Spirulina subsalsa FACHB-351 TaxID=234711 RepID=A0ABT3L168_9CYAN|nr:diguanylate cyclase [Spirulina subsalsa]MCW6035220.1 diguanylate cyclase [Spirulina subsalsa FACHB-351]